MTTRDEVKKLFDSSETKFRECWSTLLRIKKRESLRADDLLTFQPRLAGALFEIDELYRRLSQERRDYISRKSQLSKKWFVNRLRLIKNYQQALKELIGIGIAIGDSFAWLFYVNEREHLFEHYSKSRDLHTPPGIGGLGELEFLKGVPVLNDHIVIYHGTTSFLRLGDVSFVSLRDFRLKAIGEIKTKKIAPNELAVTVVSVSSSKEDLEALHKIEQQHTSPQPDAEIDQSDDLPQSIQQRLGRQMKEMGKSLDPSSAEAGVHLEMEPVFEVVSELWTELEGKRSAIKPAGKALLLAGFRNSKGSLYELYFSKSGFNIQNEFDGLPDTVISQLKENSDYNRVIINSILNPSADYSLNQGMTPVYAWPLAPELIESILFNRITLISVYNPAHLIDDLEQRGFEVQPVDGRPDFKMSLRIGKKEFAIQTMSYFIGLIARHFFSEEAIVETIQHTVTLSKEKAEGSENEVGIQLRFIQQM
jgi:hypothetical protein